MIKTISNNSGGVLSAVGGAGGGLAGWFELYGPTVWSAVIFAVVGGVLGFWVGKCMQWIYKCITKNKKK